MLQIQESFPEYAHPLYDVHTGNKRKMWNDTTDGGKIPQYKRSTKIWEYQLPLYANHMLHPK